MEFVKGKDPTLFIFEDEVKVEEVKLNSLTTAEIHDLMQEKGFEKSEAIKETTEEPVSRRERARLVFMGASRACAGATRMLASLACWLHVRAGVTCVRWLHVRLLFTNPPFSGALNPPSFSSLSPPLLLRD